MSSDRAVLVDAIAPRLPGLADEVIAAIRAEVDAYRRPLTGSFGSNVRMGVELALRRFLAEFGGDATGEPNRRVYVDLGRGEFREGRPLDALLAAYRVGARLSWRRMVEAGRAAAVAPETLYELGEAMFAYIDGLSAESSEGFAQAREAAAGGLALRRQRLATLLLGPQPPDPVELRAAAAAATWTLPATVAVLVADGDATELARRIGPDALAAPASAAPAAPAVGAIPTPAGWYGANAPVWEGDPGGAVVIGDPAAPGRWAAIAGALEAAGALGPEVAPTEAARSSARARAAHRLQRAGRLPGGLVEAADHLPALVLHADRALADELATRALAPLDGRSPATRTKLRATLRAWLDAQGRIEPAAVALGVHPQTVRYRLAQLREALGAAIDDPDGRLALDLALRASARIGA